MKFLQIALSLSFYALIGRTVAEDFIVGGRAGWRLERVNYAQWSARNVYRSGDSLFFPYEQGAQSVMRVSEEDFHRCRTSGPIEHYTEGNTIVRLEQDNYYFISGVPGHCHAGMKLEIVLAGSSPIAGPSAGPSSSPVTVSATAPSSPSPSTSPSPSSAPPLSSPVPSPSVAPISSPTAAPLSSPTVSPVSSSTPILSPPSPPPLSSPAPLASSPGPIVSSPPFPASPTPFLGSAEGPAASPRSAASALPSAVDALFAAALIFVFQL